jgi:hypothetical protein
VIELKRGAEVDPERVLLDPGLAEAPRSLFVVRGEPPGMAVKPTLLVHGQRNGG